MAWKWSDDDAGWALVRYCDKSDRCPVPANFIKGYSKGTAINNKYQYKVFWSDSSEETPVKYLQSASHIPEFEVDTPDENYGQPGLYRALVFTVQDTLDDLHKWIAESGRIKEPTPKMWFTSFDYGNQAGPSGVKTIKTEPKENQKGDGSAQIVDKKITNKSKKRGNIGSLTNVESIRDKLLRPSDQYESSEEYEPKDLPKKKADDQRKKKTNDQPKKQATDQPKKQATDQPKKQATDQPKKKADDQPKKKDDDQRNKKDDDHRKKKEDDQRKRQDDDQRKKKDDDQRKKKDDDQRKKKDDDQRKKKDDDQRKKKDDDQQKKKDDDQRKKKDDDQRKKKDDDQRKKKDDDQRKKKDDDQPKKKDDDQPKKKDDDQPKKKEDDQPKEKEDEPKEKEDDQPKEKEDDKPNEKDDDQPKKGGSDAPDEDMIGYGEPEETPPVEDSEDTSSSDDCSVVSRDEETDSSAGEEKTDVQPTKRSNGSDESSSDDLGGKSSGDETNDMEIGFPANKKKSRKRKPKSSDDSSDDMTIPSPSKVIRMETQLNLHLQQLRASEEKRKRLADELESLRKATKEGEGESSQPQEAVYVDWKSRSDKNKVTKKSEKLKERDAKRASITTLVPIPDTFDYDDPKDFHVCEGYVLSEDMVKSLFEIRPGEGKDQQFIKTAAVNLFGSDHMVSVGVVKGIVERGVKKAGLNPTVLEGIRVLLILRARREGVDVKWDTERTKQSRVNAAIADEIKSLNASAALRLRLEQKNATPAP